MPEAILQKNGKIKVVVKDDRDKKVLNCIRETFPDDIDYIKETRSGAKITLKKGVDPVNFQLNLGECVENIQTSFPEDVNVSDFVSNPSF